MNKYILIDDMPSANRNLLDALIDNHARLIITSNQENISRILREEDIKAMFVRTVLWDYALISEAVKGKQMPELVLLCAPGQEKGITCDIGMPEILTDDTSVEEVVRVLKYINSEFLQVMDYRSIRVGEVIEN